MAYYASDITHNINRNSMQHKVLLKIGKYLKRQLHLIKNHA